MGTPCNFLLFGSMNNADGHIDIETRREIGAMQLWVTCNKGTNQICWQVPWKISFLHFSVFPYSFISLFSAYLIRKQISKESILQIYSDVKKYWNVTNKRTVGRKVWNTALNDFCNFKLKKTSRHFVFNTDRCWSCKS